MQRVSETKSGDPLKSSSKTVRTLLPKVASLEFDGYDSETQGQEERYDRMKRIYSFRVARTITVLITTNAYGA